MSKVTILKKSLNTGTLETISTFLLEGFPYDVIQELGKHRLLSISCQSSRAVPIVKTNEQVLNDPFIPEFTSNQPGMSGGEITNPDVKFNAKYFHLLARSYCVDRAKEISKLGVHKQDANAILKPWIKCSVIITATSWDNFYQLRRAPGCKGALRDFADAMYEEDQKTKPELLQLGEWHIPFLGGLRIATAKCAAVSYSNHSQNRPDEKWYDLHDRLLNDKHLVPFEHSAMAVRPGLILNGTRQVFDHFHMEDTLRMNSAKYKQVGVGNFSGFLQYRKFLEYQIPVKDFFPMSIDKLG